MGYRGYVSKSSRMSKYIGAGVRTARALYDGYKAYKGVKKALGKKPSTMVTHKPKNANKTNTKLRIRAASVKGNYVGRFKDYKAARTNKQYRKGVVIQLEDGGIRADAQSVFVGVSTTPTNYLMKQAAMCVIKELFRVAGISITNWYDSPDSCKVRLEYFAYSTDTTRTVATTAASSGTYENLADALVVLFSTPIGSSGAELPVFSNVQLLITAADNVVAKLQLEHFMLRFDHKATISVQNSTLSGTVAAPDANDDVVTANPVKVKVYECKGNGFDIEGRKGDGATVAPFYSHPTRGWIAFTSTDVTGSGVTTWIKPPPSNAFLNCSTKGKMTIAPGDIHNFKCSWNKDMSFQKFVEYVGVILGFTVTTKYKILRAGNAVMVGAEKLLDSRTSENPVTLAFETNLRLACSYKYKPKTPVMPINLVATTAV